MMKVVGYNSAATGEEVFPLRQGCRAPGGGRRASQLSNRRQEPTLCVGSVCPGVWRLRQRHPRRAQRHAEATGRRHRLRHGAADGSAARGRRGGPGGAEEEAAEKGRRVSAALEPGVF